MGEHGQFGAISRGKSSSKLSFLIYSSSFAFRSRIRSGWREAQELQNDPKRPVGPLFGM